MGHNLLAHLLSIAALINLATASFVQSQPRTLILNLEEIDNKRCKNVPEQTA